MFFSRLFFPNNSVCLLIALKPDEKCFGLSQERRLALQMDIDQASKPQKQAKHAVSMTTFLLIF